MELPDLKQPELYINRELSLLEFNWRVLEQARDPSVPLLERLRYLAISSTNLDEFFEVRVAGLIQRAELGSTQAGPDNMSPTEILNAISDRAHQIVEEQYLTLNDVIFPELQKQGINFFRRAEWNEAQETWLHKYFQEELAPILTPLGLDPAHPFPRILNKSLNFIVELKGKDAFGRQSDLAIVQAPRALPRVIQLPPDETNGGAHDFVFLSSIIHAYVDELFYGMKIEGCYQFRVTRNSNLFVDEEEVEDLLRAVEGELASRRYGDAIRLEVAHNCPDNLVNFLLARFEIPNREMFQINGPVNLNRVQFVYDLIDKPELKFPSFIPSIPKIFTLTSNVFNAIKKGDILLHHPFQSFAPVLDFLRQAASDEKVLSIRQTLYRTGANSAIVDHLVDAAKAGKEVTVVVELRARFDEEANIELATRLQEAGVHIVYGVVGYKTHAKMIHIVRREGKQLRQYVHLGTGNYHARTARLYTDYGLFTCDKKIGQDISNVFLQLTSLGKVSRQERILQAPFTLKKSILEKIDREIDNASNKKPARIIIKVNALTDPQVIHSLYRAAVAGVKVDLIVRGICCLRPNIKGVSNNIQVRSIVGRFLEHTRVYYFENDGQPEIYGASADFMERNLSQRVETAFPLRTRSIQDRVIEDLNFYLNDNKQAWILKNDGSYYRAEPASQEDAVSAQSVLLEKLASQS
ncbi:polyphosphate kinase 1 [Kaarinaea lacus]